MNIYKTFIANEDIDEHKIVKLNEDGTLEACKSPYDKAIGVLDYKAKGGYPADVLVLGLGKVNCAAPIEQGDFLVANEDGKGTVINLESDLFATANSTALVNIVAQTFEVSTSDAYIDCIVGVKPLII